MTLAKASCQHFERQPLGSVFFFDALPVFTAPGQWQGVKLCFKFFAPGGIGIVLIILHA